MKLPFEEIDTNLYRVAPNTLVIFKEGETLEDYYEKHPPAPEILREWYAHGKLDINGLEARLDLWFARTR